MSTSARKRLMRDFKRIQNDAPSGIQAAPLGNNDMSTLITVVILLYVGI